jgi:hypothetical protein
MNLCPCGLRPATRHALRTLEPPTSTAGRGEARHANSDVGLRGKDGKVRRSLGFACVRSRAWNALQTDGLSERARTGANGRSHLPCRRSWVRVPSSAFLSQTSLQVGVFWGETCHRVSLLPRFLPGHSRASRFQPSASISKLRLALWLAGEGLGGSERVYAARGDRPGSG